MSSKHHNNQEISEKSSAHRVLQSAKSSARRSRLSYMLLDVFLGGFIVGIVLMITLGRPAEDSRSKGAGGEEFLLIEFDWNNPELAFNPVLKFNDEYIYPYGLSSPFPQDRPSVWARYDMTTGQFDNRDLNQRFHSITMDGFFVEMVDTLSSSPTDTNFRYGYLLLSKPCPGKWFIGMRVIDESPLLLDKIGYEVNVHSVCSGYANIDDCTKNEQPFISSSYVNTAGDPFFNMKTTPSSDQTYISIIIEDEEKDFDYCGDPKIS